MPFIRPSSMKVSEADRRSNVNLVHENHMEETAVYPSSSSFSRSSMAKKNVDHLMLAPGYRFEPSDEELIMYYLIPKSNDQAFDEPNMIWDVSLSDYTPEEIAEKYKPQAEGVWYFFTPRTRKFENGTRRKRIAGDGYWRSAHETDVYLNGKKIGSKRALTFLRLGTPKIKGEKTDWIMHEFTLPLDRKRKRTVEEKDMKLDEHVLCRMYKKRPRGTKKASRRSNENEGVQILPHETAQALHTQETRNEGQLIIPSVEDTFTTTLQAMPDNHLTIQQAASNDLGATLVPNFSSTNHGENALRGLSSNTFDTVPEAWDQPLQSISPDQFSFPQQINDDDDLIGLLLSTFVVDPLDPYELSFPPTTGTSSSLDFNPQQANDKEFIYGELNQLTQLLNHSTSTVGQQQLQTGEMWEYH